MNLPRGLAARGALLSAGLLLLIQLTPVWLAQTNPPVVAEPNWDSPTTRALAKRACFDCHSNETIWPWYSRVAPASWLVTRDVLIARSHLNFSEWGSAAAEGRAGVLARAALESGRYHKKDVGKAAAEAVLFGEMPLPLYLLLHPEAALTEAERAQLAEGLRRTPGHRH